MMRQNILCIAGTGTDVGKTVVTAGLLRAAHGQGIPCAALKPVQTGCGEGEGGTLIAPDVAVYREACPEAPSTALRTFTDACSPHLASSGNGENGKGRLDAGTLAAAVLAHARLPENRSRLIFVEGAGGLLTPLNERETLLDLFARLDAPVLLVAANTLGAINHALLSLQALQSRGLRVPGIIFTVPESRDAGRFPAASDPALSLAERVREDNRAAVSRMSGVPCLAEVPFVPALRERDPALRQAGWDAVSSALETVVGGLADSLREQGNGKEATNGSEDAATLLDFDRGHIWHPYTSALAPLRCREAARTEGCRIVLEDGTELVDGMSSWWCAVHGYRHPRLMRALSAQAGRMPHVMFGGLTHRPAVELAKKLLRMVPDNLEHVFFSDSGSVAVEVAMKMAVQYQRACGRSRKTRCMTVRGGYHGDTLGAMSVCDPENGMHSLFTGLLPEQIFVERPGCAFAAPYDPVWADSFADLLAEQAHDVAAVILEPIVQGAGGMWMYHPEYLRRVSECCREYGCLLILDEIATGFGRTGRLFASEWAGVRPDILCLGKALTGGVMSMAATLASGEVARGISRSGGVLMHGPTFMGNPLACAVSGASLDILAEGAWREQVSRIEGILTQGLAACRGLPGVADVRVLGAIGVVEMEDPVDVEAVQDFFVRECGVWLRPFGRLIYTMPPYLIDAADLERICRAITEAVRQQKGNVPWASS